MSGRCLVCGAPVPEDRKVCTWDCMFEINTEKEEFDAVRPESA